MGVTFKRLQDLALGDVLVGLRCSREERGWDPLPMGEVARVWVEIDHPHPSLYRTVVELHEHGGYRAYMSRSLRLDEEAAYVVVATTDRADLLAASSVGKEEQ
jgi:hypothetical protein